MKPPVVVTVRWDLADPVYAQIARQIRARIACGDLPAGTALPAVRALASDLGVNLNTVARAYRLLEEEGFIRIRDRSGAEVAGPSRMARGGSRDRLQDELRDVLARLRQAGTDLARLKRLVVREIAGMSGRGEHTGEG
ncbi:MAG TPA: GntR family transcriptional regulator [Candidatus Dormibacteraeota bacterium]|nr:GntR family transcriptional regulator [Candidatus Dormibacteraeota bacterium]